MDEAARGTKFGRDIADGGGGDALPLHHGQGGGDYRLTPVVRVHPGHTDTLDAIAQMSNKCLG